MLEGVPTFQQTLQLLSLGLTFSLAIANSWLTPTLAVAIFPEDEQLQCLPKCKILNIFCDMFLKAKVIHYTITVYS
jgi:hypothetical protein